MEEGVYQIRCKECKEIYTGETKFTIRKRMEHTKNVKFEKTSNTNTLRSPSHQIFPTSVQPERQHRRGRRNI